MVKPQKPWDDAAKRLIHANPQQFLHWVLKDAIYKELLCLELKNQTREADVLIAATWHGQDVLIHIEFQSTADDFMEQRMLEYSVLARIEYKRPVYSYVIYLRSVHKIARSPLIWTFPTGDEVLRYCFCVINMWEIPAEELLQTNLEILLPFLPLSKDGKSRATTEIMISAIVKDLRDLPGGL